MSRILMAAIIRAVLPMLIVSGASAFATAHAQSSSQLRAERVAAYHDWAYTLAVQAATWGAPLVTMYSLRHHDAVGPDAKAKPNAVWRMEDISTPELSVQAGYVTPNVNVIYGFGFLDLRREPVVLTVPNSEGRYYMVQIVDMWTNAFAYVGGRATGFKGGTYVLTAPGWNGPLPDGVHRIDCPTPWVLIQPRVHVYRNGEIDVAGARKILDRISPVPLSRYLGQQASPEPARSDSLAPDVVDPKQSVSVLAFKDPLQFWDLLSAALNENPPPRDQITALVPMFKALGIGIGTTWNRDKIAPPVLVAMREAAQKIGTMLDLLPIGRLERFAAFPPADIGNFGTDYLTRAVIGRIGLTANTPEEAVYWTYRFDSDGQPLTGDKKYTLTFAGPIPYDEPGFWSITMYDYDTNYTVSNPINRYMLGSDSRTLKTNSDGSFTIHIQRDSPGADKEANWLPAPAGRFYLIPRAYLPKKETIDLLTRPGAWPLPVLLESKQ